MRGKPKARTRTDELTKARLALGKVAADCTEAQGRVQELETDLKRKRDEYETASTALKSEQAYTRNLVTQLKKLDAELKLLKTANVAIQSELQALQGAAQFPGGVVAALQAMTPAEVDSSKQLVREFADHVAEHCASAYATPEDFKSDAEALALGFVEHRNDVTKELLSAALARAGSNYVMLFAGSIKAQESKMQLAKDLLQQLRHDNAQQTEIMKAHQDRADRLEAKIEQLDDAALEEPKSPKRRAVPPKLGPFICRHCNKKLSSQKALDYHTFHKVCPQSKARPVV